MSIEQKKRPTDHSGNAFGFLHDTFSTPTGCRMSVAHHIHWQHAVLIVKNTLGHAPARM